jgi:hypothetical protein
VIEFVLQTGDRPKFDQLFKLCKNRFTACAGPETTPAFAPMPLSSPTKPSEEDVDVLVSRLVEMVATHLPDTALEATQALVHLSAQHDLRPALKRKDVIPCLKHLLEVDHIRSSCDHTWLSCRLFSVTCLANLSEEPMLRDSLYDATHLFIELVGEGTFRDRAMRREATRALRNLAQDSSGADQIIRRIGKPKLQYLSQTVFPTLNDQQMKLDVADIQLNLERRWPIVA